MLKTNELFNKPGIIGIVADVNQGKSMVAYNIINELNKTSKFKLYHYGLRLKVKGTEIKSIKELEKIKNSLIIADEFFNLFDLDNRKAKKQIERTLRLINHDNNVLVLIGTGENFKQFISNKLDSVIYKQVTISDMINGSRVKKIITDYNGDEKGSEMLNLEVNEALVFDGEHYTKVDIPYLKEFDSKLSNAPIFVQKAPSKSAKSVPKNVQKTEAEE